MEKREGNKIIGWKAIAEELEISVWAVKNLFRRAGVTLPKMGVRGRTSPVFIVRGQLFSAAMAAGLRAVKRHGTAI